MSSNNIFKEISSLYVKEVLSPQIGNQSKKVTTSLSSTSDGDAQTKRIRQAVYDIRYRSRREEVSVEQAFNQYMSNTSMNAIEKKAVKEKLGIGPGSGAPTSSVKEESKISEEVKDKYKVRVTDRLSGKSYVRLATRSKINQLRANPNISSVEMTGYGSAYDSEIKKGSQTKDVTSGKGLAKKDYDGDGKLETPENEWKGSRDKSIKKSISKKLKSYGVKESSTIELPPNNNKDLLKKQKNAVNRSDSNIDGFVDKKDKKMGPYGAFIPTISQSKIREGYSNWREDLREIVDDTIEIENKNKIKEKKINNYSGKDKCIDLSPKIVESFEEIGGKLFDITEINDNFNFEGILDEFSNSELYFLSDDLIEEIVLESFIESIEDGYEVDYIEQILTESLETSLQLLFEDRYDSAVEGSKKNANLILKNKKAKIRSERTQKIKDTVKKVGKDLKSNIKNVGKSAAYGAGYVAGKTVSAAKKVGASIKDAGEKAKELSGKVSSAAKSGYSAGKGDDGEEKKSKSSGTYRIKYKTTKRPSKSTGLLSRIGSTLKKGIKKAISSGARSVSRGARNIARRMEEAVTQISGRETNPPETTIKQAEIRRRQTRQKEREKLESRSFSSEQVNNNQNLENTSSGSDNKNDMMKKQQLANKQKMMQKKIMLQKQELQLQKQGKLPMGHTSEEVEIVELTRYEKEKEKDFKTGKPSVKGGSWKNDPVMKHMNKLMGSSRMGVQPRGKKKVPGEKPPRAGEYGGPASPAQKVEKRRADTRRAQDMMHSRFD